MFVPVRVGVEVGGVPVTVGVGVPQTGWVKTSSRPELRPPVLHWYCVYAEPNSLCTPTVAS